MLPEACPPLVPRILDGPQRTSRVLENLQYARVSISDYRVIPTPQDV